MKIQQIYDKYKIMPQLQLHMLRVAGAASIICDNFERAVDKNLIISACLLHDIGSIVKFKLGLFDEHSKGKGVKYWKEVQKDFIKKYGNDDHKATLTICSNLDIDNKIITIINGFGFANSEKTLKSEGVELTICVYSDMRVSPNGIVLLKDRLEEAKKRYLKRQRGIYKKEQFEKYIPMWMEIEKQIFTHCKLNPADITEEKVSPFLDKLSNFEIMTNS